MRCDLRLTDITPEQAGRVAAVMAERRDRLSWPEREALFRAGWAWDMADGWVGPAGERLTEANPEQRDRLRCAATGTLPCPGRAAAAEPQAQGDGAPAGLPKPDRVEPRQWWASASGFYAHEPFRVSYVNENGIAHGVAVDGEVRARSVGRMLEDHDSYYLGNGERPADAPAPQEPKRDDDAPGCGYCGDPGCAESPAAPATSEPTARDAAVGMLLRCGWGSLAVQLAEGKVTPAEAAERASGALPRLIAAKAEDRACIAALEALARGDLCGARDHVDLIAAIDRLTLARDAALSARDALDEARAEAAALRAEAERLRVERDEARAEAAALRAEKVAAEEDGAAALERLRRFAEPREDRVDAAPAAEAPPLQPAEEIARETVTRPDGADLALTDDADSIDLYAPRGTVERVVDPIARLIERSRVEGMRAAGRRVQSDGPWGKTYVRGCDPLDHGVFDPRHPGGPRAPREQAAHVRAEKAPAAAHGAPQGLPKPPRVEVGQDWHWELLVSDRMPVLWISDGSAVLQGEYGEVSARVDDMLTSPNWTFLGGPPQGPRPRRDDASERHSDPACPDPSTDPEPTEPTARDAVSVEVRMRQVFDSRENHPGAPTFSFEGGSAPAAERAAVERVMNACVAEAMDRMFASSAVSDPTNDLRKKAGLAHSPTGASELSMLRREYQTDRSGEPVNRSERWFARRKRIADDLKREELSAFARGYLHGCRDTWGSAEVDVMRERRAAPAAEAPPLQPAEEIASTRFVGDRYWHDGGWCLRVRAPGDRSFALIELRGTDRSTADAVTALRRAVAEAIEHGRAEGMRAAGNVALRPAPDETAVVADRATTEHVEPAPADADERWQPGAVWGHRGFHGDPWKRIEVESTERGRDGHFLVNFRGGNIALDANALTEANGWRYIGPASEARADVMGAPDWSAEERDQARRAVDIATGKADAAIERAHADGIVEGLRRARGAMEEIAGHELGADLELRFREAIERAGNEATTAATPPVDCAALLALVDAWEGESDEFQSIGDNDSAHGFRVAAGQLRRLLDSPRGPGVGELDSTEPSNTASAGDNS